jgi:ribosomal protein S18 acetylase RimI-like enzyme
MITIRQAVLDDFKRIANLHASSWLKTYRGILPDSFLDNNLIGEREQYWKTKMSLLKSNEFVLIAEDSAHPVGFIAVLDRPENGYDAFIDNLHVRADLKGKGIGKILMRETAKRLLASGRASVYLWVLKGNHLAEKFYVARGARVADTTTAKFGDMLVEQTRYCWPTLDSLLLS